MASKPLQRVIKHQMHRRTIANYQTCTRLMSDTNVDRRTEHDHTCNVSSARTNSDDTARRSHGERRTNTSDRHVADVSNMKYSKQPIRHVHNVTLPEAPITWYGIQSADRSTNTVKSFEEIPGPKTVPFLGGLFHYLWGGKYYNVDIAAVATRLYAEYGSVVKEAWPMGFNVVHVYNPDDVETVYRSDGKYPLRHAFAMMEIYNRKYANDVQGLLTSHGENWHRLRRSVQQKMLKPKAVAAYLPDQTIVADDLVARIHDSRDALGDVIDLRADLYKYAAESIGVVCFNTRLGALRTTSENDEAARYIDAVNTVMEASLAEFNCFPFWRWIETPTFKRLCAAQSTIRRLAEKYSDLAVEDQLSRIGSSDGEAGDMIPYLLTKSGLTRSDVITIISELITAGVDTTAHFLAFALYGLACSPDSQTRLLAELDAVVPEGTAGITATHLEHMPYLRALLLETLRYHPITSGSCRTLTKDVVCSNYTIPKGTFVAMRAVWATRLEDYFARPNVFAPERWLRDGGDGVTHHPFVNNQFGFGSRSCIGKRLAKQEVSVALVKILQKYRIEFHGEPLQVKSTITLTPTTPLNFRFVERR